MVDLIVEGDPVVNYSPGMLLINIANGPPFVQVQIRIDAGPALVFVDLDEVGAANGVSVPVNVGVGDHTLYVENVP